jgi:RHS repeat-associated protein
VLSTAGVAQTSYGYSGEQQDASGRVYLRARVYEPGVGRYLTRDTWGGNNKQPMSYNVWLYGYDNPIKYIDPTGKFPEWCKSLTTKSLFAECVRLEYNLIPPSYNLSDDNIHGSPGCWRGAPAYVGIGYLEGTGVFPTIFGISWEVVYDFATMEQQVFENEFYGLSDSLVNQVTGFDNYGLAYGFESNSDIATDYMGPFGYGSLGMSPPFPGVIIGGNVTYSFSLAPLGKMFVAANYWSIGVGDDLIPILDIGVGVSVTRRPIGSKVSYTDGHKVNKAILLHDILSGNHSPQMLQFQQLTSIYRPIGVAAALYFSWLYDEVHSND